MMPPPGLANLSGAGDLQGRSMIGIAPSASDHDRVVFCGYSAAADCAAFMTLPDSDL